MILNTNWYKSSKSNIFNCQTQKVYWWNHTKNVQISLLEKCTSKPQGGIISHLSEWQLSKNKSVGKDADCWGM